MIKIDRLQKLVFLQKPYFSSLIFSGCGIIGSVLFIFLCYFPIEAQIQSEATLLDDTYVASGREDEAFSNLNSLSVGYWDSFDRNIRRSMLKFDFPVAVPANATITSATLTLAERTSSDDEQTLDVLAQRLIGNWDSTITWKKLSSDELDVSAVEAMGQVSDDEANADIWEFEVKDLLQDWVDDPNQEPTFSILLSSRNENPPNKYVAFESKDCSQNCTNFRPKLSYELSVGPTDTPTVAHTPTSTHTPTPTSTPVGMATSLPPPTSTPEPTPGIKSIAVKSFPFGVPSIGDTITYTVQITNGESFLSKISVFNIVPDKLEVQADTLSPNGAVNMGAESSNVVTVTWQLNNGLTPNETRLFSYQAVYPTPEPTPTPTELFLTGSAPSYAEPREIITYAFTLTNYSPITATNIIITNPLTTGLIFAGGTEIGTVVMPPTDNPVLETQWSLGSRVLAPNESLTVSFLAYLETQVGVKIVSNSFSAVATDLNGTELFVQSSTDPITVQIVESLEALPVNSSSLIRNDNACVSWARFPGGDNIMSSSGLLCVLQTLFIPISFSGSSSATFTDALFGCLSCE